MDRSLTWEILKVYNIPYKIISLIKDLYTENKSWLYVDGLYGEQNVKIERGVRQGCILSSMLFSIMFDYIVRKVEKTYEGIPYKYDKEMNYHSGNEEYVIKKVIYGDDVVFFVNNVDQVKSLLKKLDTMTKRCGMKVSFEKTFILEIGQPEEKRTEQKEIQVNGNTVKFVNNTTHLGRIIENGMGGVERHKDNLINRINKAKGCFEKYKGTIWMNGYIPIDIKLFESLVLSVLFYCLDTLPVRRDYLQRVKNFVIKCYKIMMGINSDIKISKEDLVEMMGIDTIENKWYKKRITSYSHSHIEVTIR